MMFKIRAAILFLLNISCSRAQDVPLHTDLVFIDDSVCVLTIDYGPKYSSTYKTGIYKLKEDVLYFSEITKGFHYIAHLDFAREPNLGDDSLEIELFISDPIDYGWTDLDSMKFNINGTEFQSQLITPSRESENKRSHFIKIKRPLAKQLQLSAYAQDSAMMIYKRMYFIDNLCLSNSFMNKLYIKMYTFLSLEGNDKPLESLLPKTVSIRSRIYKVKVG